MIMKISIINHFEERINGSEQHNDTQWLNNWLMLRNLMDSNQNQLTKMGQIGLSDKY